MRRWRFAHHTSLAMDIAGARILRLLVMDRGRLRELIVLFVIGSALTLAVFFLALWLLPFETLPRFPSRDFPGFSDFTSSGTAGWAGRSLPLLLVYGAQRNNSRAAPHNGRVHFGSVRHSRNPHLPRRSTAGPSHQNKDGEPSETDPRGGFPFLTRAPL